MPVRCWAVEQVPGADGPILLPAACASAPWTPAPDPSAHAAGEPLNAILPPHPARRQLLLVAPAPPPGEPVRPAFAWPIDGPAPEIDAESAFDARGRPTWPLALALLDALNLPAQDAGAVIRHYGGERLTTSPTALFTALAANPFSLCELAGPLKLAWAPAEGAAAALGGTLDDTRRGDAAAAGCLTEARAQGSNCLPAETAQAWVRHQNGSPHPLRFSTRWLHALPNGQQQMLINPDDAAAAHVTAARIHQLTRPRPLPPSPGIVGPADFALDPGQQRAVSLLVENPTGILAGGPGTGKTTTLRTLVDTLDQTVGRIAFAAFSGQAARRIRQATGRPASTIHRLIGKTDDAKPPVHGRANPLNIDCLVIDEASMIPADLFAQVLQALPDHARLILCGDPDQLPPIDAGCPFADILHTAAVPVARITTTHRVQGGSDLLDAFHALRDGRLPPPNLTDFQIIDPGNAGKQEVAERLVERACKTLPAARPDLAPEDIQLLSPVNHGPLGVHSLNRMMQERINPDGEPLTAKLPDADCRLRAGDPIAFVRNDRALDVSNGTRGRVIGAAPNGGVTVAVDDGRPFDLTVPSDKINLMRPAYCISVHKSQGSEYKAVLMPAVAEHLTRGLIYTAATRAKQAAVLFGSPAQIEQALRRQSLRETVFRHAITQFLGAPDELMAEEAPLIFAPDEADEAMVPDEGGFAP